MLGFCSRYQILAVAILVATNYSVLELNAVFGTMAASYILANTIAIVSVFFLGKNRFASILLLILALGTYQSAIFVALTIWVLILIDDICKHKTVSCLKLCLDLFTMMVSAGLYFVLYKWILYIKKLSVPKDYHGVSIINLLNGDIFNKEYKILKSLLNIYVGNTVIEKAIFVFAIAYILIFVIKNQKYILVLLSLSLLLIQTVMTFLAGFSTIRPYANFSMYLVPLLLLIIERQENIYRLPLQKTCIMIAAIFCVVCLNNLTYSNRAYSVEKLMWDRSLCLCSNIAHDISEMDEYESGLTEVVFVGELRNNTNITNITYDFYGQGTYRKEVCFNEFQAFDNVSFTYSQTLVSMMNILGYRINCENDNDIISKYQMHESVLVMPKYPSRGYIQYVDDKLVVKLSDIK